MDVTDTLSNWERLAQNVIAAAVADATLFGWPGAEARRFLTSQHGLDWLWLAGWELERATVARALGQLEGVGTVRRYLAGREAAIM